MQEFNHLKLIANVQNNPNMLIKQVQFCHIYDLTEVCLVMSLILQN